MTLFAYKNIFPFLLFFSCRGNNPEPPACETHSLPLSHTPASSIEILVCEWEILSLEDTCGSKVSQFTGLCYEK